MQATTNEPVSPLSPQADSPAMVNLPPYSPTDQHRISRKPINNQTGAQDDDIVDIPPSAYTQATMNSDPPNVLPKGADAIITIPEQRYVTPLRALPDQPAWIDCPFCHKMTQTKVEQKDSSTTQLYGVLCCLFCGIIGVCVPYLCHWAQETDFTCSKCGNRVAFRPNEGPIQVFSPQETQQVPSKYAEAGRMEPAPAGTGQARIDEKR